MYIGHSEPVHAVAFTPDQQQVLSVGDAIFLWDVLATPERQVSALDCVPSGSPAGSPDTLLIASSNQSIPRASPAHDAGE